MTENFITAENLLRTAVQAGHSEVLVRFLADRATAERVEADLVRSLPAMIAGHCVEDQTRRHLGFAVRLYTAKEDDSDTSPSHAIYEAARALLTVGDLIEGYQPLPA